MKYNQHFFIISFCLIVSALCNAMENNNELQQYKNHWLSSTQEITAVEDPWGVRYLTKGSVIISENNGIFHKVNLKTHKKGIKNIICNESSYFGRAILQKNNNKIIMSKGSMLAVCDTEITAFNPIDTGDSEITSLAYNSLKDVVFLCSGGSRKAITVLSYATRKIANIPVQDQMCHIITMHPKKEVMCIADYLGNIGFYNYSVNNTLSTIKAITLNTEKDCSFCQYSLNGSCIVAGNATELFIIDPEKNTDAFSCVRAQGSETFSNIAFHPNGLLAILCSHVIAPLYAHEFICNSQFVRFFDLKTQQCIGITPVLKSTYGHDLCISDDGLEVMVVLEGKCVRMHVPFAIKEKFLHYLCVLNRIKGQGNWPNDIVRHCGNMLLESFKF